MKRQFWKWFWWAVVIIAAIILLVYFLIPGAHYLFIKIWKPKTQSVKRQTFEETKSYVFAARQDLAEYYRQWKTADPVQRKAIESAVRMRFSDLPPTKNIIPDPVIRRWFRNIIEGN